MLWTSAMPTFSSLNVGIAEMAMGLKSCTISKKHLAIIQKFVRSHT